MQWLESQSSSMDTHVEEEEETTQTSVNDIFNIVSLQSTAHPGCIIQLESIVDAKQVNYGMMLGMSSLLSD